MWIALVVVSIILASSIAYCAWLVAERRSLCERRDGLTAELADSRATNESLRNEIRQLERDVAALGETKRGMEQAQQQSRDAFRSLAAEVLKDSGEQFLQLASERFRAEQATAGKQLEASKQAVDALIAPIGKTLENYNESIQNVEKTRRETYGQLQEQVRVMVEDQRRLRRETANLVQALRRPEVRGRWGEMQLRRVAELAGMIEHCDFVEQHLIGAEERRLQPDMIVKLPSDRTIVVDAKTPLDAYLSATECTDHDQRNDFLDQHIQQIEQQIRKLAAKQYQAQFERSPDLVVLFIPGESFLQAAVERRTDLIENAMTKGIMIATPTTLIGLLKAVALGWREQRLAENAQQISELGKELHDRLGTILDHVRRVGSSLSSTVSHYNNFVGSFETRVLVTARKFEQLGAESAKSLPPQLNPLETVPRDLADIASQKEKP